MKKVLLTLVLTLLSINSFASMTHGTAIPKQKFAPMFFQFAKEVPTQYLYVEPGKITGFQNYVSEDRNLGVAFDIIQNIINSEEFKSQVINFLNKSGNRSYTNNDGLTNEQVYERIMQGKELINGDATEGEMNFDVSRYNKKWSKVIGYTNMGKNNTIHVNGKFYRNYLPSKITANITHEWLHLMGFVHSSASDHDSIPYAVGYIMGNLADKYVNQGFLE